MFRFVSFRFLSTHLSHLPSPSPSNNALIVQRCHWTPSPLRCGQKVCNPRTIAWRSIGPTRDVDAIESKDKREVGMCTRTLANEITVAVHNLNLKLHALQTTTPEPTRGWEAAPMRGGKRACLRAARSENTRWAPGGATHEKAWHEEREHDTTCIGSVYRQRTDSNRHFYLLVSRHVRVDQPLVHSFGELCARRHPPLGAFLLVLCFYRHQEVVDTPKPNDCNHERRDYQRYCELQPDRDATNRPQDDLAYLREAGRQQNLV